MKAVQKLLPVILPVCVTTLIFGCGGGSKPAATATEGGPDASATGTATPPPAREPTPPPTIPATAARGTAPAGFYQPEVRTGIPVVDAVIDDMMARDAPALQSLVQFSEVACAAQPMGVGSPPKCADGEVDGQLVDVLPGSKCEGVWIRPGQITAALQQIVGLGIFLYAVYQTTDADFRDAKYGVIFGEGLTVNSSTGVLINEQGRIVYVHGPCGQPPNVIPPGRSFLLPPIARAN